MRHTLLGIGLVAALVAPAVRAENVVSTRSPQALLEAVKSAFNARSVDDWKSLVGGKPLGENDKIVLEGTLRRLFEAAPKLESIELVETPAELENVLVAGGRKYELTLKPVGAIRLDLRIGKQTARIDLPYGKVGEEFRLATLASENLNWRGPEDREYALEIRHTGDPSDIEVFIRYNASGVDLTKRVKGKVNGIVLPAQYIESVELERTGGKGETSFAITCAGTGDANARVKVFDSESLYRAGTLTFKIKRKPGANEPGR